jgi:proline dehydrogenase
MIGAASRALFSGLAASTLLRRLASRYGLRRPGSFARRFIAGETIDEAIAAARAVEARGLLTTLDFLGERVTSFEDAERASRAWTAMMGTIADAGVNRNISVKLTQLGLDIDRMTAVDNLRRILEAGRPHDFFVRIDMESSHHVDRTLEIFETLWGLDYHGLGVAIQSYLRRSDDDVRRLNTLGAPVRLVKGAYHEPRTVAYADKAEVDAAFLRQMRALLAGGTYPAIATHDDNLIEATLAYAAELRLPRDRFEFQMLFGVRRDLQASLVAQGHRVRVYIPFGRQWFPYFMRRMAERPANVMFLLGSLARERGGPRG